MLPLPGRVPRLLSLPLLSLLGGARWHRWQRVLTGPGGVLPLPLLPLPPLRGMRWQLCWPLLPRLQEMLPVLPRLREVLPRLPRCRLWEVLPPPPLPLLQWVLMQGLSFFPTYLLLHGK